MSGSQVTDVNTAADANRVADANPAAGGLGTGAHQMYLNAQNYLMEFPKTLSTRPNPYSELVGAYEKYMKIHEKGAAATVMERQAQAEMIEIIKKAQSKIEKSQKFSFSDGEGKHKRVIDTVKQMIEKFRQGGQAHHVWKEKLDHKDAVLLNLGGTSSGLYITGGFDADAVLAEELRAQQQRDWTASFFIMVFNLMVAKFASDDRAFNAATQKFVDKWNADNNASSNYKLVFNPEKYGSMIVAQSKADPTQIMALAEALKTSDLTTSDLVTALNADYKRAGLRQTITLKGNDPENAVTFDDGKKQSVGFNGPGANASKKEQSVGFNNPGDSKGGVGVPAGPFGSSKTIGFNSGSPNDLIPGN